MSFFSLNIVSESNCNARRKSFWPEFRKNPIQKSSSCIAARRNKSQVKKLYYYHLLSFSSVVVVKLSSVCCVLWCSSIPWTSAWCCSASLSLSLVLTDCNAGRACASPCNQTSWILFSGLLHGGFHVCCLTELLHGMVLPCVLPGRITSWSGSSSMCAAWQACSAWCGSSMCAVLTGFTSRCMSIFLLLFLYLSFFLLLPQCSDRTAATPPKFVNNTYISDFTGASELHTRTNQRKRKSLPSYRTGTDEPSKQIQCLERRVSRSSSRSSMKCSFVRYLCSLLFAKFVHTVIPQQQPELLHTFLTWIKMITNKVHHAQSGCHMPQQQTISDSSLQN